MFARNFAAQLNSLKRICSSKYLAFILLGIMLCCLPQKTEANVRLCGIKLTSMMKFICKNHVCGEDLEEASHSRLKRAYINADGEIAYLRHVPHETTAHFLHRITKRSGDIVQQCCSKRCSYEYLKTFCCYHKNLQLEPNNKSLITTTHIPIFGDSKS